MMRRRQDRGQGITAYMTLTDFGGTGWLRFRGMGFGLGLFLYILDCGGG